MKTKEDAKIGAEGFLKTLRRGTDMAEDFIGYVRAALAKGGLTLADIGTTEQELEQLRIKGCKQ